MVLALISSSWFGSAMVRGMRHQRPGPNLQFLGSLPPVKIFTPHNQTHTAPSALAARLCHFRLMQYSTLGECEEDRNRTFSRPPMEAFMSPSSPTTPNTSEYWPTR